MNLLLEDEEKLEEDSNLTLKRLCRKKREKSKNVENAKQVKVSPKPVFKVYTILFLLFYLHLQQDTLQISPEKVFIISISHETFENITVTEQAMNTCRSYQIFFEATGVFHINLNINLILGVGDYVKILPR